MKYRRFFVFLILFSLLLELSDSSTNFIRTNLETSRSSSAKAIFDFDGNQDNQHSDSRDSNSAHFDDLSVHYSYPATNFVFASDFVQSSIFVAFFKVFTDQYYPSIFQPPKIA